MAATAEALMNSLSGGSDGTSESADIGTEQPGSGASSPSGDQATDRGVGPGHSLELPASGNSAPDAPAPGDAPGLKPTAEQLYQNAQAAIRETRAENKTLKQQLAELTAKIDSLAKPAPSKEEAPAEPDFLADPKGYVDDAKAKLKQLTDQIEADKAKQTEAQKQQQAAQETWNKVIAAEAEFASATPDYHDALNHVRAIRAEQIKIEIRETEEREPTQEEVGRILSIQEAQGAAALIAKGKNPSKFYYEYAKTFGYKPNSATAQPNSVSGRPNSATAAVGSARPDKEAVRTMGSGGAGDSVSDEPASDSPLGGLLAAAQTEHRAQFKRRK